MPCACQIHTSLQNLQRVSVFPTFHLLYHTIRCPLWPELNAYQRQFMYYFIVKNRLRLFNSPAPQSWGEGFLFSLSSCIIVSWISYRKSLQTIMKKLNIPSIPDPLRCETLTKWSIAAILLTVVPCISSGILIFIALFLKAVTAMMAFGAISNISTIIFCATLSVPHFLMKWNLRSVSPSKK